MAGKRKRPVKPPRGVYEKVPGSDDWWICYFVDGKRRREHVGLFTLAVDVYRKRKNEVREGRFFPEAPKPEVAPMLKEAIETFMAGRGAGLRSILDYRLNAKLWTDLLGTRPLYGDGSVTPSELEALKQTWRTSPRAVKLKADGTPRNTPRGPVKESAINRRMAFLSVVYRTASDDAMLRTGKPVLNPCAYVAKRSENNKRSRFLRPEEYLRLRAVFPPAWWHAVDLAIFTGLRQDNMFALRWDDVDFDMRRLRIPQVKSGGEHHVEMNARVVEILETLPTRGKSEWVFSGRWGGRLNHDNWLRRTFRPALVEAGIVDLHWHDLRHTTGSWLRQAGVPEEMVAEILGHSNVDMTRRYSHVDGHHRRTALDLLIPFTVAQPVAESGSTAT